ncbi:MAG: ATP-binding protein [Bacteroidia bacterium]|nr:ATP-binding protein [Bacteroidia bacterium]
MNNNAHFKVDPRLASLLGENYRSTELAIKELIDNAYDADASEVWITLPKPLTLDPILIKDDGTGMTEAEVRDEYLNIASSRASRKGERTRLKNRLVKGRKGIGKFAGLMVASHMEVRSMARGKYTHLIIFRDELFRAKHDLEQVNLPMNTGVCDDPDYHGTEIILTGINQQFTFPNADRLRRLLMLEYGRSQDFKLYVDGELVDIEDIPGDGYEHEILLSNGESASLRYTISDGKKPLKQSGLAIRVGGKIVGNPRYFGLEDIEEIPPRLLRRLFGEVNCDALEPFVTADWGAVIDNSRELSELEEKMRPVLLASFRDVFSREIDLTRSRLKRHIEQGVANIPAHRRKFAERAMDQVLHKFYGESEARVAAIIGLVLDAFGKSEYSWVMQQLEASREGEQAEMVQAFTEFGMLDVALIAQQSSNRLAVLKDLERILLNPATIPAQLGDAISNNLWLLGNQYGLVSGNKDLDQAVKMYVGHKYTNGHAHEAPNLLLLQDFNKGLVLLDLNQPDHTVSLADRRRAIGFQDDLKVYLPQRDIEVIVFGGAVESGLVDQNNKSNATVRYHSYKSMLSEARVQLNWLLSELNKKNDSRQKELSAV